MRKQKVHLAWAWLALSAGAVALLAVSPAQAEDAPAAATAYVPTTADYLAVTDVLQRYRVGVDSHDEAMVASAFWEDGEHIAVPSPGLEIRLPLGGGAPLPPPAGQPGPNAGPPPGLPPGPPPGAAGEEGGGEVWHLPLDSYIHFESATRATHYGYFLSIYPGAERPVGNAGNMREARTSIVGWPGHYEDVLEKRNGEWRILSRRSEINQK